MNELQVQENNVLDILQNDGYYSAFLTQNNHSSITSNSLAKSMTITEQVKKLSDGIELLSKELQVQVLENHQDLLQQANHAGKLENVLNTMNYHVQNLFANAERLKSQIAIPYQALESHTKVLGRLHLASHMLRQVNRIQQLSKRLANTSDPVQQATILQELEQLAADPEVNEIDAVITELRNIRAQQQKIVRLATSSLTQGIANENSAQTTTALQIFINLGTVSEKANSLVEISVSECCESLKSAFICGGSVNTTSTTNNSNHKTPGKVTMVSSQGFRNRLWTELEKVFSDEIYQQCKQIKFLQTTLNTVNNNKLQITQNFWKQLGEAILNEINNCSLSIQQMLEENYPKLLKSYYEMTQKLDYKEFSFNRSILGKCETSYLSASLNRMMELTQGMFSVENIAPSHDQIDSLLRTVSSELTVALVEENLTEKTAKNIAKCIKLYTVKTEQKLSTGVDAAQVIGGAPNVGQQQNVQLANSLYYLQTQIQRTVHNLRNSLSGECIVIINESIEYLDSLTEAIIQPLIVSINNTIETILITMHLESDWTKSQNTRNISSNSCSPYMRELTQFISRVYQTYLANFQNKDILTVKCRSVAERSITLLVRHISLLAPLSNSSSSSSTSSSTSSSNSSNLSNSSNSRRLRLQADCAHLETSLRSSHLYPHLPELGRPYRLLRSVARLVTLPPQEAALSQLASDVGVMGVVSVPYSTVLLMLFAWVGEQAGGGGGGGGGIELESPHQSAGWGVQKMSRWLDEHEGEKDRLDLIAGALQRYETLIRQKNSTNFDPVYPIMSELLAKAIKETIS